MTSPDGSAWTTQESVTSAELTSVTYANDHYVAVGEGAALRSNDGFTWELLPPKRVYGLLEATAFGAGKFVSVGGVGMALSSPTGATWMYHYAGTGLDLDSVAWSGSQYVATAWGAFGFQLLSSPDGVAWTSVVNEDSGIPCGICWGNGRFVVVGNSVLLGCIYRERYIPGSATVSHRPHDAAPSALGQKSNPDRDLSQVTICSLTPA